MQTQTKSADPFLGFRYPATIAAAVETAAERELISKSDYARRAIVQALQRDGLIPSPVPPIAA